MCSTVTRNFRNTVKHCSRRRPLRPSVRARSACRRMSAFERPSVTGAVRAGASDAPRLKRALKLKDLVLYGVIIVCPISPAPFFGALIKTGHGHAAFTILIALFAMFPPALSYGRYEHSKPSAGSDFAYVARETMQFLVYIAVWVLSIVTLL